MSTKSNYLSYTTVRFFNYRKEPLCTHRIGEGVLTLTHANESTWKRSPWSSHLLRRSSSTSRRKMVNSPSLPTGRMVSQKAKEGHAQEYHWPTLRSPMLGMPAWGRLLLRAPKSFSHGSSLNEVRLIPSPSFCSTTIALKIIALSSRLMVEVKW